ncbi:MAG: LytR/AlgR family response regulator transcription factor [Bacteroidia bacterium]
MNCLIVDDNQIARVVLKQMVSGLDFLELVGECQNVTEATNLMNKQQVDLLLLDVEMPKVSGIDFLKTVPEHPLVILITAKPDYAVEAFEYNIVDFLLKPVREDRFLKAIYRARDAFESRNKTVEADKDYFFIREKGVSSKLVIADILYIQALGDYVNIHTTSKKYTIHYSISAIEKKLPASKFMRVHRSYILALDKVDTVEEGTAFVYQTAVPVGDSQRSELMKRLNIL